jgi:YidC/Oxa1 family membrane protein insertase
MFVLANIVQPLIDLNEGILRFWHNTVGFGWGASIIGLTMVVRLAILPLTFKQVRSMQALQRLQPEMKKIQQRYKDDKQRQQQAMMEFYKEHQVNPLGSCLPLILQFPFFIGLYQTLRSAPFKREVGENGQFLFIPDITKPLTGHTVELVVMIVIYVGTQLLSSYVSSFNVQDKNQKRLLFLFPFLFVPVVINFEAGLLVYWITTNTWTIGQQLFVRKFLPPPEPHVAAASAGGGGGGKTPVGARAASGTKAAAAGRGNGGDGVHETRPAKRKAAKAASGSAAAGSAGGNGKSDGRPGKAPPPSPRKKKKRSGRRR